MDLVLMDTLLDKLTSWAPCISLNSFFILRDHDPLRGLSACSDTLDVTLTRWLICLNPHLIISDSFFVTIFLSVCTTWVLYHEWHFHTCMGVLHMLVCHLCKQVTMAFVARVTWRSGEYDGTGALVLTGDEM